MSQNVHAKHLHHGSNVGLFHTVFWVQQQETRFYEMGCALRRIGRTMDVRVAREAERRGGGSSGGGGHRRT